MRLFKFQLLSTFAFALAALTPAFARSDEMANHFVWRKDQSTAVEVAASREDRSVNFFDVGNLSPSSLGLVKESLSRIASAAGYKIDRSAETTIAIIHDTNVFDRLLNDKHSFSVLGIPDAIIVKLSDTVVGNNSKCLAVTVADAKNIDWTIILLSEAANDCLAKGLLESFGVKASEIDPDALLNVCALYEGRRLNIRDRSDFLQNLPRLRNNCLVKSGGNKG